VQRLRELNNFNTLMAVVGGLTHSCLARLSKTNSYIPHETQKVSLSDRLRRRLATERSVGVSKTPAHSKHCCPDSFQHTTTYEVIHAANSYTYYMIPQTFTVTSSISDLCFNFSVLQFLVVVSVR